MNEAMYIAATGLKTSSMAIDVISNNLANVNTPAFKKSRISFDDVYYKTLGAAGASGMFADREDQIGMGASVASVKKIFSDGDLKATQNSMDIAIKGGGFLEVRMPNGDFAYTRNGSLKVAEDGSLRTADGYELASGLAIPADATSFKVAEDGSVTVSVPDLKEPLEIGRIELASFINESGMTALGNGMYLQSDVSGSPSYSVPGEDGTGKLQQGFLESSNVSLVGELLDLVVVQQAFSVNSQIVKASDQMMQIVNNLRQ